jgi:hypothetical protein
MPLAKTTIILQYFKDMEEFQPSLAWCFISIVATSKHEHCRFARGQLWPHFASSMA